MRLRSSVIYANLMVALLLAGCASPPERTLSQQAPSYATLPNGYEPLNPTDYRQSMPRNVDSGDNLIRQLERKRGHALNMLSLSGGGQNGAFGAGFLIGWRESGRRPEFDVVGGVSTGALLATHAFLGTPADDAKLEEMYTQVTKDDIYQSRGIFSLLSGADSLRDTAPLRALIAKYITAETLRARGGGVRRESAVGRWHHQHRLRPDLGLEYVADREGREARALSQGVAGLRLVPHRLSAGGNRWPSVRRRGRPFERGRPGDGRNAEARVLRCTGRGTST